MLWGGAPERVNTSGGKKAGAVSLSGFYLTAIPLQCRRAGQGRGGDGLLPAASFRGHCGAL